MDITPLVKSDINILQSYQNGVFKVSGKVFEHAITVSADIVSEFPVQDASELNEAAFQSLIDNKDDFDVVLLGTGNKQVFLQPDLSRSLKAHGLSIEPMDTGAACRTYNVLIAEGRRVIVVLLPHT